jgi:hypothetical protein
MPRIKSNVPELETKAKDLKTVVLLPPRIEICEVSAGGVKQKRDDWCEAGRENVKKALAESLREKGVHLKFMKVNRKNKKEIKEINALYRAVASSIYSHTFMYAGNMNVFTHKIENFDYSIGSVEKLLRKQRADGLLIVYGADEVYSKGRKTLAIIRAINPFSQSDQGEIAAVVIGLTDKSGSILWFRTMASSGRHDLRDPESTHTFVKSLVSEYPGGGE